MGSNPNPNPSPNLCGDELRDTLPDGRDEEGDEAHLVRVRVGARVRVRVGARVRARVRLGLGLGLGVIISYLALVDVDGLAVAVHRDRQAEGALGVALREELLHDALDPHGVDC